MEIDMHNPRRPSYWAKAVISAAAGCLLQVATVTAEDADEMPLIITGDKLVEGWKYELALYGWAKSIDGTSNSRDVQLDFREDILDMIEGAFMVSFDAEYGRWLGFAAYEYTRIGTDQDDVTGTVDVPIGEGPSGPTVSVPITGDIDVNDPQHMFELGAGYKVVDGDNLDLTLHAGARYYDYNLEVELKSFTAVLPPPIGERELGRRKISSGDTWWQPFVGVRLATHFTENWRLRGRVDYGYGSSGDSNEMWLAELLVDWRFNHWGALELGYRHVEQDYDNGSSSAPYTWDMTERGPRIGLIIHF
jgi:hypothetical protein